MILGNVFGKCFGAPVFLEEMLLEQIFFGEIVFGEMGKCFWKMFFEYMFFEIMFFRKRDFVVFGGWSFWKLKFLELGVVSFVGRKR